MKYRLRITITLVLSFLAGVTANSQDKKDVSRNIPASSRVNVSGTYNDLPQNYQHPVATTKVVKGIDGTYMLIPPNFRPYPSVSVETGCDVVTETGNQNVMYGGWNSILLPSTFYTTGWGFTSDGGTTWSGFYHNLNNLGIPAVWIWPAASTWPGRLGMSYLTVSGAIGATYSTNNGTTWAADVTFAGVSFQADKCLSAVDDVTGSPYLGRAYTVFTDFNGANANRICICYSTNGGVSWSTEAPVSPVPASGHHCQGCDVEIGPGGVVYVVWAHCVTNGQNSTEDNLGFAKSTDGGVTWSIANNNVVDVNGIRASNFLNGIRVNGYPRIAVDKSGGSRNGYIYVTMCEKTNAPARDAADVTLMRSTDGGAVWTHTLVNQDAAGKLQWHSSIAVNPNNGDVAIAYYDQRNTTSTDAQFYVSYSNNGGNSFTDFQASDHIFTPDYIHSVSVAAGYSGDYTGVTWANNKIYPFWNDESVSTATDQQQIWSCTLTPVVLAHDYSAGPWLSFPAWPYLINTNYTIKTKVTNLGSSAESSVPVKWFVDGLLINSANISLAAGASDSVTNVFNTSIAGNHTLMYIASLGTDLDRTNDTIRTTITVLTTMPPLCEQFSTASFPPANWSVSGSYWGYSSASGFGIGTGSARYNMWSAPVGTNEHLTTLTFPATVNPFWSVIIDMAYAPYPAAPPYNQDSLIIQASTNGGTTWISIARLGPLQLQTAPPQSTLLFPNADQWKKRFYTLPVGTNKIDFFGKSAFGNDLFLDSICTFFDMSVTGSGNTIPLEYSLEQNYPNPFNPATNIRFGLPKSGLVKMVIYDVLGRVVTTLVNEYKEAGTYTVDFDASAIASGVYFYRIESGSFTDVKKMLLIK